MRLVLISLFVLLSANLLIELLDSNLMETIQERNNTIERLLQPPSSEIQ